MFYNEINEDLEKVINKELKSAKEEHGDKFSSYHEFYAVLKEEVEEYKEHLQTADKDIDLLWKSIKEDDDCLTKEMIFHTRNRLSYAMMELIQSIAVCDKALDK